MFIMDAVGIFFAWLLRICYSLLNDFGWAIWLFTLLTKIVLLPVSILVQINSIKMVKLYPEMNRIKAKYHGDANMISEAQYNLYKKAKYHPMLDLIPVIIQLALLMGVVDGIHRLMDEKHAMLWYGINLADVPLEKGGMVFIIPFLAAVSALVMCLAQNWSNVLQSEQSRANKISTTLISVGLSLYLGLFVAAGIGLYWIAGNVFATLQIYVLNFFINPRKHIDYEDLEASRKELSKISSAEKSAKKERTKEEILREKADYKRFMKYGKKQIVFYAERKGFYKYFKDTIEYILRKTDIEIHYISSDINDDIFEHTSDTFHTYYIGDYKIMVLMMKLEAELMVMTTPDFQKYHIKRSYVDKNIEYIYMPHDVNSSNLTFHKDALDHFDTIFTSGPKNKEELLEREEKFKVPKKNLVEWGSSVIDDMKARYESMDIGENEKKIILIAPSWQKDNLLDICIEDIMDELDTDKYQVIIRPHPQYVRMFEDRIDALADKYSSKGVVIEKDFSSNRTVYTADMLITDWSSIAYEYAFSTLRPVLFINTPMKVVNPDYKELASVPIDIEARDAVGISVETDDIKSVGEAVESLFAEKRFTKEAMAALRDQYIYNVGSSGAIGGKYMINRLLKRLRK